MAPRLKGGGQTPKRIVELLQMEVEKSSQAATARATGLTLRGVQNYLKGKGDPTTATLNKLSESFKLPVEWLRGELCKKNYDTSVLEMIRFELEKRGDFDVDYIYNKLGTLLGMPPIYVEMVLDGMRPLTDEFISEMAKYLRVSENSLREVVGPEEAIKRIEYIVDIIKGGEVSELYKRFLSVTAKEFGEPKLTGDMLFKLCEELFAYAKMLSPIYSDQEVKHYLINHGVDVLIRNWSTRRT